MIYKLSIQVEQIVRIRVGRLEFKKPTFLKICQNIFCRIILAGWKNGIFKMDLFSWNSEKKAFMNPHKVLLIFGQHSCYFNGVDPKYLPSTFFNISGTMDELANALAVLL